MTTLPTKRDCEWNEPSELAKELSEYWGEEGMVWLDGDNSQKGRWGILAGDPINHISCHGLPDEENAENPFKLLRKLEPGHWTGWLSYEAASWLEPQNPWKSDSISTLWMARHDPIIRFDFLKQKLWIEGYDISRLEKTASFIKKIPIKTNGIREKRSAISKVCPGIPIDSWQWESNYKSYAQNVSALKKLIARGDIFQANLSICCTSEISKRTKALDLFRKIRSQCPAPFSGVMIGKGASSNEAVISSSPEQFLMVNPSGFVETRPIKGTRPRDLNPSLDAELAADLICSVKDRAENLMIVDLLRNDLGRVCRPGSITVPEIMKLESYQHVHHLTSVVKGHLNKGKTWVDLLEACWPGGSISGAPKLRACERLYELEPNPRGPYCGSFLHLDWDGKLNSNLLIRSLMLKDKNLRVHAGCGIVADSKPEQEVEELKWKLLPLLQALE